MVAPYCDAVDINLGCPQHIARRGHYGSFLMEDWPLIASLISTLHKHLPIPVTAKIRVFPEADKTVAYAKMAVEAGAQILVVHGRLREMKGHLTGVADWEKIRLVREAVGHLVPVIANGNILYHEDVAACIEKTGCVGVMSAEGNLYNPAIFTPDHPESWRLAEEYLTICDELDTKIAYTRGHLFKIFRPSLNVHTDLRTELAATTSREEMWEVTRKLKARLVQDAEESAQRGESFEGRKDEKGFPILPHWVAQPYFRQPMPPQDEKKVGCEAENNVVSPSTSGKRTAGESIDQDDASSVRDKKKNASKKPKKSPVIICADPACQNSYSPKCIYQRCKQCCRNYQREQNRFDCPGHVIKSAQQQQEEKAAKESKAKEVTRVQETPSPLPRIDSEEALAGVALEGMIVSPDEIDATMNEAKSNNCSIL